MSDDASKQASTAPPSATPTAASYQRHPAFANYFTNQARVRMSPGEVTLVFAYLDEPPIGPLYTEIMGVSMTPTSAKRLWGILGVMLSEYQKSFGDISVDPAAGIAIPDLAQKVEDVLRTVPLPTI